MLINGMTEREYLLGAITLVRREIESALLRGDAIKALEASQRLTSLQDCLVAVLQGGVG